MAGDGPARASRDAESDIEGIAALADPRRLRIYRHVVAQEGPVSREQVASALNLPRSLAASHLDRLAQAGLLDVEYRRLSERTGPGAGRPSKLYRRARRQFAVSMPPRDYELPARLLARGVLAARFTQCPIEAAVANAARSEGLAIGRTGRREAGAAEGIGALIALFAAHRYEPRRAGDELVLANCPFHALVDDFPDLVCGMNRHFVGGLLEGMGATRLQARLAPNPGGCCVRVQLEPDRHEGWGPPPTP